MTSSPAGLQAERTRLAWQRTGLAMGICALLLLRYGLQTESWLSLGQAVSLGVAAALLACAGTARGLMLDRGQHKAPSEQMIQQVTVGVIAVAICVAIGFLPSSTGF